MQNAPILTGICFNIRNTPFLRVNQKRMIWVRFSYPILYLFCVLLMPFSCLNYARNFLAEVIGWGVVSPLLEDLSNTGLHFC